MYVPASYSCVKLCRLLRQSPDKGVKRRPASASATTALAAVLLILLLDSQQGVACFHNNL